MCYGLAANVIVFGRGISTDKTGVCLSEPSLARVHAVASYIEDNLSAFSLHRPRVVFSGGQTSVARGKDIVLTPQFSEASLMLEYARGLRIGNKASLDGYADMYAEVESDSTLENVLKVKEGRYFMKAVFTAESPLGLVAHREHLKRIHYLVSRVFELSDDAIVDIIASGDDTPKIGVSEGCMLALTRLAFFESHSHASLRRRQRLLAMALNVILPLTRVFVR
jgi:hypothetical protein